MTIRDTHFTARRLFLEACGVRPLRNLLAADNRVSGIIWCGHSVRAGAVPGGYRPNGHLVLTTDFLDRLLFMLREAQIPVVRLAEARARLMAGDAGRFACFTFDDGYADNVQTAYPIFERHGAPFTVFVTTGFVDRLVPMWWSVLEHIIGENEELVLTVDGVERRWNTRHWSGKARAFAQVEDQFRFHLRRKLTLIDAIAKRYGTAAIEAAHRLPMTWEMANTLAAGGLAEIGCHSVSHPSLSRLLPAEVEAEVAGARSTLEQRLDRPVRQFAYPYGDAGGSGAPLAQAVAAAG